MLKLFFLLCLGTVFGGSGCGLVVVGECGLLVVCCFLVSFFFFFFLCFVLYFVIYVDLSVLIIFFFSFS